PIANAEQPAVGRKGKISTLYLFVHCLGNWDSDAVRRDYADKWQSLFAQEGTKEDSAICFLTSGPESMAIVELARKTFGQRCIVDPVDNSMATKALIADDLDAAFKQRGNISEWTPYEMWTSTNARKWTEGLKKELQSRRLTYDPQQLQIVACGQQWGGCLTKYSIFMTKYLGLAKHAEIRPELSPYAGYPLKARFRECITLDRQVQLFLFETADGRSMAQFLDGMRGVSEPPHVATIPLDAAQVELVVVTPSDNQQVQQVANPVATGSLLVDVGDGCRPVITSVLGKGISFDAFRA